MKILKLDVFMQQLKNIAFITGRNDIDNKNM